MRLQIKSFVYGIGSTILLLLGYSLVLTMVSGWSYMLEQFTEFWPYVVSLAVGFGVQVTLYFHLRQLVHSHTHGGVVAVSGTTSTIAMVSCCTHYLVNLLPVLGVTGLATVVSQYQIELFWVGILANLVGVSYMIYKIKNVMYA